MEGLELLGAVDAIADQYITIRVRHIDRDKLKNKLGGSTGTLASAAMSFVDFSPKGALDAAKPFIVKAAKDYGMDAEVTVSNVPPSKGGRALSEFWPGLGIGVAIGAASLLIVKGVGKGFSLLVGI